MRRANVLSSLEVSDVWVVAFEADHILLEHGYYVNHILCIFAGEVSGATESNFFVSTPNRQV